MAKTNRPRRNKARIDRIRADCARRLNVPWPEVATTEDEQRYAARKLNRTRWLPARG